MELVSAELDVGQYWASVAPAVGRILLVAVIGALTVRVACTLIMRVDDRRFREQLLFFVPEVWLWLIVVILGLAAIGIDVSGMAAIMATVGFTGAVVFTPVGQNLVAGAMIRIDDIYQVGDAVTVGDLHGHVVYRSMLRTELALPDGSTAWVPNSSFQENQVLNHSRMGGWRICVQVPLDRASDRVRRHRDHGAGDRLARLEHARQAAFLAFDRRRRRGDVLQRLRLDRRSDEGALVQGPAAERTRRCARGGGCLGRADHQPVDRVDTTSGGSRRRAPTARLVIANSERDR